MFVPIKYDFRKTQQWFFEVHMKNEVRPSEISVSEENILKNGGFYPLKRQIPACFRHFVHAPFPFLCALCDSAVNEAVKMHGF
jgi:hypothetical protein